MSRGFERNITARSRGGIMRLFAAARYSFEKNVVTRRTSVPWTVNIHASRSIHFLCRFWLFDIALPRRFANSCPSSESLGASACPSWWTRPPACLLLAYAQSTFYHTMRNLEGLQTSKGRAGCGYTPDTFLAPAISTQRCPHHCSHSIVSFCGSARSLPSCCCHSLV